MGNQERPTRFFDPQGRQAHYPSWGSGTISSRPITKPARATHYPSWGSGTNPERHMEVERTASLPLMGIQELGLGKEQDRGRSELTTPHGDQEQRWPAWCGGVWGHSLPLMGIRNYDV